MTCDEAKACFADDWCGILRAPERNELQRHLEDCAACRQEAEGLESLWTKLDSLPAEEPSPRMRDRFYAALGAYGEGFSAASTRERRKAGFSWLPVSIAAATLLIGLGLGYAVSSQKGGRESTEIAQLRGEVNGMRELVALSLLRQQSASERLRGVSWANQVESSDGQVLAALLDSVNHDPNVNVRLAAADALRTFAMTSASRTEIAKAIIPQSAPLVQIALIDLVVDLKDSSRRHPTKAGSGKRFVKPQCSRKSGLGSGKVAMNSTSLKSIAFFAVATMLAAQDPAPTPQRITLPFSDPSRPKSLSVDMPMGSVKITGYDGNDAVIEYSGRGDDLRHKARQGDMPPGMHRLDQPANAVEATQENNVVRVKGGSWDRLDIAIKVPKQTALDLKTMNGSISVEGISGEMTIDAMNGHISVQDASGPVVAHSMNGRIVASVTQVSAAKASSFSSMNGSIEVTLPADLKAHLKIKTDHGEIYTDFDVKVDSSTGSSTLAIDGGGKNGGVVLSHTDHTLYGTINGGGPEMQFITYNGRIVIRKK